jgi:hypothetical protein
MRACIEFHGDLYAVPRSEADVYQWLDAAGADKRLGNDELMLVGIIGGLMLRAIRTGEGLVYP